MSEIDVVKYLSDLGANLDDVKKKEEWEFLRPALADLYRDDRATFALAASLVKSKLGVGRQDLVASVRALEEPGATQATVLMALADDVELFHTPDSEAWAVIPVNGHRETWSLKNKNVRRFLSRRFYEEEGKAPGSQALQDALNVLEAKALFEGPAYPVFTRIASYEGKIYVDLSNEKWEAIEISSTGWRLVSTLQVRFRRTKGMLPLPLPEAGGTVEALRPFVNIRKEDWPLLIAWLLMAFSPRGPYPVLGLSGAQGSIKSTTARVLRSVIDPSFVPLRTAPREERDLMISANAGWTLAFDNLSTLPQWLSDAFCRLATGGGFSTRELYTNDEETLFDAQRPVLFTAIEDIVLNGDLVDRGIRLLLPFMSKKKRKPESIFRPQFEQARPRILGALLDIVASILKTLPSVQLKEYPRMADFALWVTAAEPALKWEAGTFLKAYNANRMSANEVVLDASHVATAVIALVELEGAWEGQAKDLLVKLRPLIPEQETKAKSWPKNALSLSNALRRLVPSLKEIGIEVSFSKTSNSGSKRLIRISKESSDASDAGDADRDAQGESSDAPPFPSDAESDASQASDASSDASQPESDAKNTNEINGSDASDASDAQMRIHSNGTHPHFADDARESQWSEEL